ncbi:hypothetical protein, partial [Salmonella enterica]
KTIAASLRRQGLRAKA